MITLSASHFGPAVSTGFGWGDFQSFSQSRILEDTDYDSHLSSEAFETVAGPLTLQRCKNLGMNAVFLYCPGCSHALN